jgi:antitoxin Phd
MKTWSAQDAGQRFEELLDACIEEGPQMVAVGGIDTAVLVAASTWAAMQPVTRHTLKELLLSDSARTETLVRRR